MITGSTAPSLPSFHPLYFRCRSLSIQTIQRSQLSRSLEQVSIIHERLMYFIIFINETMFTIGESRAISHSDDTEQQAQQEVGNPRFLIETPLENAN